MRAQIKLLITDASCLTDLHSAGEAFATPRYPCLGTQWLSDSPNRLMIFFKRPGALREFLQMLPSAEEALAKWYGDAGSAMVRQIHSEILYFSGKPREALDIAKVHRPTDAVTATDAILAQCTLFRCYLATGFPQKAEQSMLEMIRISKDHPECADAYQSIRHWANLTTGWSGENPRFLRGPQGEKLPVLEDRLEAIREGYSRISPLEDPFVRYAQQRYQDTYTMRSYYMDIFHAIYWFQAGDTRQADACFQKACQIALATGLIMPFAEYGRQIIPLLRQASENDAHCPKAWYERLLSLSERYEEFLEAYRS